MTFDELVKLRDHADAAMKIVLNTIEDKGRFNQAPISSDMVDKALDFFLSVYPNSPLKEFR